MDRSPLSHNNHKKPVIEQLEGRVLNTAYLEQNGLVVIEAEKYDGYVNRSSAAWSVTKTPAAFSGTGAMYAGPNTGRNIDTSITTTSPELRYNVTFTTPGLYNLYVRGQAANGQDDTVHVGLDGKLQTTSTAVTIPQSATYTWGNSLTSGVNAQIVVGASGTHTLNVYMREDGFVLDKIVLSKLALKPSGTGPTESKRSKAIVANAPPNPTDYPNTNWSVTSQAWTPVNITRASYLDRVSGIVRAIVKYQNTDGAIIDPYEHREVQYSTPYFAYSAATLINNGLDTDLLAAAVKAMDHATSDYAAGKDSIPDQHGEFYIAPLAGAYSILSRLVTSDKAATWLNRLKTPLDQVLTGHLWNWRTYAMKGVWMLYGIGAMSKSAATSFIESSWTGSQKANLVGDDWNLYLDGTSNPDTLAYDAASRSNLFYLILNGYDGASKNEMQTILTRGNKAGLYLVDPTGQAPTTGRSGNHTWNDIVSSLAFEREARILIAQGDVTTARTYRHASELGIKSADRWRRSDGLYQITKNQFSPADRVGYADYSFLTNYNGYVMYHLSELYNERRSEIGEAPTPAEAGGYALQADSHFSTIFADAGGLQIQGSLRGQIKKSYGQYWTELGLQRISKMGWDSRLGTLEARNDLTAQAVTFAPTFYEGGKWKRMAEQETRYQATFSVTTVTPTLIKATLEYTPKSGQTGPTFTQNLVITPDGIQSTTTATAGTLFGMSLPLLINDGTTIATNITGKIAANAYYGGHDVFSYLALDAGGTITNTDSAIRGATGDIAPLRLVNSSGNSVSVFLYPSTSTDPSAIKVQSKFHATATGFTTILGQVNASIYTGRYLAGGFGSQVDVNNDSIADVLFSVPTQFVVQLKNSLISAVQVDHALVFTYARKNYTLNAGGIRTFAV